MNASSTSPDPVPADRVASGSGPSGPGRVAGAVSGLLAALVALAVAELVSGIFASTTSPVVSVGEWVIDHVPPPVKTFAISTFGTNDKVALIGGTLVLLLVFATVIGVLARRRGVIGDVGIAAFGVVGAATALTRPTATAVAVLPSVFGATAAIFALRWLLGRGHTHAVPAATKPAPDDLAERPATMIGTATPDLPAGFDRRRFLRQAALVGSGAVVVGAVGRSQQGRFDVSAARANLKLPTAASAAPAVPAGTDLGVAGITPFMTTNADFYRVDTALVAPQVAPESWSLKIHGMVDRELTLSYQDLLDRRLIERDLTMVCVSNEVGGPYAGTARWLGMPLSELLDEVGVQSGADQLVSKSVDGWTAGTPVSALRDGRDAMIAVGMNGEPLPVVHGFPARIVVPGLYGYTSATKWVTDIELTTFGAYDAYWVQRGWAKQATIKTLTRIDTPRGLATVPPGRTAIGGVAWAIHRGIRQVEVQVDDGPWRVATLGSVPHNDTWRQWTCDWDATPGSHTITARATDETGELQTTDRAAPIPDGASGWHSIVVLVG